MSKMVGVKILIWSFVLLVGSSIVRGGRKRVFGGKDAKIENHPYQVSLRAAGQHFCGGVIISEKHILTAAHCVVNPVLLLAGITVHTGTGSTEDPGHTHELANFGIHPNFGGNDDGHAKNDIALLLLADPITFDKYQSKINLPEKAVTGGMKVNLTGWGLTSQDPNVSPVKLQLLQTSVATESRCNEKLSVPLEKEQLCTIREKRFGACKGDSGGPLVANEEVVGIVSWGGDEGERCGTGDPDIYTDVFAYKDFITFVMNNASFNNPTFNFDDQD